MHGQMYFKVMRTICFLLIIAMAMATPISAFADGGGTGGEPTPTEQAPSEESGEQSAEGPPTEESVPEGEGEEAAPTEEAATEESATEEPAAEETVTEEVVTEEVATEETVTEEPFIEEPTTEAAAPAESADIETPAAEEATVAEVVEALNEAEAVLLDATGEPIPLASEAAAEALTAPDPIGCPAGVQPVSWGGTGVPGVDCTVSYTSIQEAIDDGLLDAGWTIYIESGTYVETITFGDSTPDNLTLFGDPDNLPVIDGGVKFANSTPITGLTLQNLYFMGTARPTNETIFWFNNSGAVNDFTLADSVLDGEGIDERHGITGNKIGGDFTITDTEFKNISGFSVMDIDSGGGSSPAGGNELPLDTVTFANNYIHDVDGSIALRGNPADLTTVVNVYGNVWENIGGNFPLTDDHWAAIEVNHADGLNFYDNTIANVTLGIWGEGQAVQLWDIGTLDMHDNSFTDNAQGIYIYGGSLGGSFGGPYAISGGSIYDNIFSGNTEYQVNIDPNATGDSSSEIAAILAGNTFDRAVTVDHPGSSLLPTIWSAIQDGVIAAEDGDTIYVLAGTYTGNILIDKSVTLTGDPGDAGAGPGPDAPIIDGGSTVGSAFFIDNGVSDVNIRGFEMANFINGAGAGEGNGISAWEASTSNVTIMDNYFHDLGWNAVLVGNDGALGDHTGWTISNNVLEDYDYYGFELTNASNSSIEDNIIHASDSATAILIVARRDESNITIQGNTIDGTINSDDPGKGRAAIYVLIWNVELANPTLDGLTITGNDISTTGIDPHILIYEAGGTVTNVEVHNNNLLTLSHRESTGYPAYTPTEGSGVIDATNNYWGCWLGPNNPGEPGCGTVAGLSYGSVIYDPWLTVPYPQVDIDGDGVKDGSDNCPNTANHGQEDTDGDGVGDACEAPIEINGNVDLGDLGDAGFTATLHMVAQGDLPPAPEGVTFLGQGLNVTVFDSEHVQVDELSGEMTISLPIPDGGSAPDGYHYAIMYYDPVAGAWVELLSTQVGNMVTALAGQPGLFVLALVPNA